MSDRSIGDVNPLRVPFDALVDRQLATSGHRWMMLDEVHGTAIVDVDAARHDAAGDALPAVVGRGDVLVTGRLGTQLGVWVGDCAPVAVLGDGGTLLAVHAGWVGLADGVVDVAMQALARRGERPAEAVRGPTIGPCCYEFGETDLARVARGVGAAPETITGRTSDGGRALDVPAAVRAALGAWGVVPTEVGGCTGCDAARWFSHRARQDEGRHALVAWSERR